MHCPLHRHENPGHSGFGWNTPQRSALTALDVASNLAAGIVKSDAWGERWASAFASPVTHEFALEEYRQALDVAFDHGSSRAIRSSSAPVGDC
jgi:hypothetical protein